MISNLALLSIVFWVTARQAWQWKGWYFTHWNVYECLWSGIKHLTVYLQIKQTGFIKSYTGVDFFTLFRKSWVKTYPHALHNEEQWCSPAGIVSRSLPIQTQTALWRNNSRETRENRDARDVFENEGARERHGLPCKGKNFEYLFVQLIFPSPSSPTETVSGLLLWIRHSSKHWTAKQRSSTENR